ncbi:SNAPIN protein homolog [Bacillus rossius redtenbacheri]|uniref:SNAPIN protein homolog n=1 Tax=Bacillus rossius redtenbacheri TaxID=93214 RepID=UPI002FDE9EA1
MDLDTESTTTSIDDKTEDFGENPTRDTLAEGLMCLLKPTIDQLDDRVRAVRISQVELKQQIDGLSEELKKISDSQACPLEFDAYVRKLMNAKLKVTVVSNILQTAQERLNKVHANILKEAAKRKTLLEPSARAAPLEASQPSIQ